MGEPTATDTHGAYKGYYEEAPIALDSPFIIPDRKPEATITTWGQIPVAETIYEVDVSIKFQKLVDQWSKDTLYMSSITARVAHPSYLEIIAMGEKAVPLILGELEKAPNYWFHALTAITKEDPIPKEAWGRLGEMTEVWLKWGRDKDSF